MSEASSFICIILNGEFDRPSEVEAREGGEGPQPLRWYVLNAVVIEQEALEGQGVGGEGREGTDGIGVGRHAQQARAVAQLIQATQLQGGKPMGRRVGERTAG